MFIEEALPVVRLAPLRNDAASAADHAAQAVVGVVNIPQPDAAVNGEVVHPLLALLYQGVAEKLPRQILGTALHLLHSLIHRHRPDRHGTVADYPFARLVDVVARGEVHQRIAAPLAAPHGLLHLLLDGGRSGGIADVGVDFYQETGTDYHRLGLGMVDVGRQRRPSCSDFLPDELRRDVGVDAQLAAVHVLADSHILHLRGNDTLFGIIHLRHLTPLLGPVRKLYVLETQMVETPVGEPCPAVFGSDAGEPFHLPLPYPLLPQPGQPLAQVYRHRRVAVCPAGIVDVHRRILRKYLLPVLHDHCGRQPHTPHPHAQLRIEGARHIDLFGIGVVNFDFVFHSYLKLVSQSA